MTWESMVKMLCRQKIEHGVAQKLQPLIRLEQRVVVFVHERTMSKGAFQQTNVVELNAK
jgi:hypothetical protein